MRQLLAGVALVALVVAPALAGSRSPDEPELVFAPVVVPPAPASGVPRPGFPPDGAQRQRATGGGSTPVPQPPAVRLPANPPRVVAPAPPTGGGGRAGAGGGIRGVASWYCGHGSRCSRGYPGGLYAAIRRDLLDHRGDRARVCSKARCVVVTVIDCNCGARANLIDLYADAFSRLAPTSRGRIPVTLAWL